MTTPPELDQLKNDATLIDLSTTITNNYSKYHQVVEQLKSLQEWVQRIQEESENVNDRTEDNKEKIR